MLQSSKKMTNIETRGPFCTPRSSKILSDFHIITPAIINIYTFKKLNYQIKSAIIFIFHNR